MTIALLLKNKSYETLIFQHFIALYIGAAGGT